MPTTLDLLDEMPQNTFQPSVPFNQNRQVIGALLVPVIEDIALLAPPTTLEADIGKTWIVAGSGGTATGDWATHELEIALCTAPDLWVFYEAPTELRAKVLNDDGTPISLYYRFTGSAWVDDTAAGLVPEAPNDGQLYARQSEAWEIILEGVYVDNDDAVAGQAITLMIEDGLVLEEVTTGIFRITAPAQPPAPVVDTSDANTDADETNAGNYTRFSHASATYTFDDGDPFEVGAEYHGRYVGSGTLTITEAGTMTVNAPADGTLIIPPGGTFTVKIVAADEADLFGVTVPA